MLGAGPAGLAAAWLAARRGRSVVVLERSATLGGMSASFDVAGVRVDHGSHRLHPATPPRLLADLRGLLGADLQTRRRHGRLRLAGTWTGFPLRGREVIRALPPALLAAAGRDAVIATLRRRDDSSYAAALRSGLGDTLYELVYAPYAEKLWGLPGESIDAHQAHVRVGADTPGKLAARLLRPRRGGSGGGQGQVFHYPRLGFGQIAEAIAQAAVAAGASIKTETQVSAVTPTAGGVTVETAGGGSLSARYALSTLPLPLLARLSRPCPPASVGAAAAGLRFRAMVLVYLVHEGGRWSPYDAHYLPGLETPVTRLSEPANYRSSVDDPADRSVLCAELPCAVGDSVWRAGDQDLADLVTTGLAVTGLPPLRLGAVEVRRLPRVYPIFDTGYAARLDVLDAWASSLPSLTSLGRLGLFAHDNSHHALAMGYAAAEAIGPDGSLDRVAWARARAGFVTHVVED